MTPTPNLLAISDNQVLNLAYLVEVAQYMATDTLPRHIQWRYCDGTTDGADDPDGALFARLRERAWPLLEKP